MSLQNDDLRAVAVSALYEKNANDKTPMDLVSIGDTYPKYEFFIFRISHQWLVYTNAFPKPITCTF